MNQIPETKAVGFQKMLDVPTFHDLNEIGLKRAYKEPNKLFIDNNNLYIAGTSSLQDVWDDLKIPFHMTKHSQRYQDAEKMLKANPQVNNITGHSLGASVALELEKNNSNLHVMGAYGTPTISNTPSLNRFRKDYDPVSMFNRGSYSKSNSILKGPLQAHDYKNMSAKFN